MTPLPIFWDDSALCGTVCIKVQWVPVLPPSLPPRHTKDTVVPPPLKTSSKLDSLHMADYLAEAVRDGGFLVTSSGKVRIYKRGTPEYSVAIAHRFPNGISKVTPYVAEPGNDLELLSLLEILAEKGIPFGLKGGGHISIPKIYPSGNGLLVAMKQFNKIEYNKAKKTLDVGAGVIWKDVYEYLEYFPDHMGVVGGDPVTGVSGWLLGGGYSILTNLFGLGIDNVVGFRVLVPAKGICDVSPEKHPEIFKALKGGSHNFGIITQFTLRVHDFAERTDPVISGKCPEDRSDIVKAILLSVAQNEFPPELVVVAAFRHDLNLMSGKMESFVPFSIWLATGISATQSLSLAAFNENRDKSPLAALNENPDLSQFFFSDSEGGGSISLSKAYETFALRHLPVSLEKLQTEDHFEHLKDSLEIEGILLKAGDLIERQFYTLHQNGDKIDRDSLRVFTAGNKTVIVGSPPDLRGRMACIMVSTYTRTLLDEAEKRAKELSTFMVKHKGTRVSFEIWPFHKKAFDGVKRGDSAWPHEEGNVIFPLIGWLEWSGAANDKFWLSKISNALEKLRKVALQEQCTTKDLPVYLNIALEDTSVKDIYRDHYGWLKDLRDECDPDNVMGLADGFVIP